MPKKELCNTCIKSCWFRDQATELIKNYPTETDGVRSTIEDMRSIATSKGCPAAKEGLLFVTSKNGASK